MSSKSNYLWIGLGLGALGLIYLFAETASAAMQAEEARRMFTVKKDANGICSINWAGPGGDEAAGEFWDTTMQPYVEEQYAKALRAGEKTDEDITAYILDDLFPGCTWPPPGNALQAPTQWLVWARTITAVQNLQAGK